MATNDTNGLSATTSSGGNSFQKAGVTPEVVIPATSTTSEATSTPSKLKTWLKGHVKYVIEALLLILSAVALILHHTVKSHAAAKASVALIEAAHAGKISALQQQITDLSIEGQKNAAMVGDAQAEVNKRKDQLKQTYKATGMSPDEIADRFSKLSI